MFHSRNKQLLTAHGIGFILNVTKELKCVHPPPTQYQTIEIEDDENADIAIHFEQTNEFIRKLCVLLSLLINI